jgi:hypothetical protein
MPPKFIAEQAIVEWWGCEGKLFSRRRTYPVKGIKKPGQL